MNRIKVLLENLRRGVVTEQYPFKPIRVPERLRGKPVIDPDKCAGCGACVNACPPNALTMRDDKHSSMRFIVLFIGRCIYCGKCEEACPFGAIRLTREFELAAENREDLYQVVGLRLYHCPLCGEPFTTVRLIKRVVEALPEEQRAAATLCPRCRESVTAHYRSYARR